MPITKELENLRKFESVGFTHEQSEVLTDVIENAIVDNQQSLKEFIGKKFDDTAKELINLELRIKASHTDLLIKIFGIIVGCASIAVAVSKLL